MKSVPFFKDGVNALAHNDYGPFILYREKGEFPQRFFTKRIPVVIFFDPDKEESIDESLDYKNVSDFVKKYKVEVLKESIKGKVPFIKDKM